MESIWQELSLGTAGWAEFVRITFRMVVAAILGAVIGYEREKAKKAAGLRTHILVTLGTCVFVLGGAGFGMNSDGLSRIIQGITTGVGFIGAGSILKLNNERDIRGLTTSAGIWMASAIGVAAGLGEIGLAVVATAVGIIVLALVKTQDNTDDDDDKNENRSVQE
jgi:putative Mg2+ transporter-C (MgtC) family protein